MTETPVLDAQTLVGQRLVDDAVQPGPGEFRVCDLVAKYPDQILEWRVLCPDDAITLDMLEERLNIYVNAAHVCILAEWG